MSANRNPFKRGGSSSRGGSSGRGLHFPLARPTGWHGSRNLGVPPPRQPLGNLIQTIKVDDLFVPDELCNITGCECVASYNWLDRDTPTILVPGMPPRWTPPDQERKLPEDSGDYYRDTNAAKYPAYPMEPAMRALLTTHTTFDLGLTDVVGCNSTIGDLLRFVRSIDVAFRFDVELLGDCLFLIRKENSPTELIPDVRGYGHTFPAAYTTWDYAAQDSIEHHRLLKYSLGKIACLVRSEKGDAYLAEALLAFKDAEQIENDNDLILLSSNLQASSLHDTKSADKHGSLSVQRGGTPIPQHVVMNIKTRSHRKKFDKEEIYPRLWVSQIPYVVIARHKFGHFEEVQIEGVEHEVAAWEERNAKSLSLLAAIMKHIRNITKQSGKKKLEVIRLGASDDKLEIRERAGKTPNVLPDDLMERLGPLVEL